MTAIDRTFLRLALYLEYGLPLVTALDLAALDEKASTRKALAQVKARIENGSSLADAMRQIAALRPHAGLIAVAEEVGWLEIALRDIATGPGPATFLHWVHRQLPGKAVGAALVSAAVVLPLRDRRVVEKAKDVTTLAEAAGRLPELFPPPMAAVLEAAPNDEHRLTLLDALAWAKHEGLFRPGTQSLPDARLRLFIGLHFLIRAGMPLVAALRALAPAIAHAKFKAALTSSADRLEEGSTLTDPLNDSGLFSPAMIEMIRLAETCGALDNACRKIAEGIAAGLL